MQLRLFIFLLVAVSPSSVLAVEGWFVVDTATSCDAGCAALTNPSRFCNDEAFLAAFTDEATGANTVAKAGALLTSLDSSLTFDNDDGECSLASSGKIHPAVKKDGSQCRTRTQSSYAPSCSFESNSNWKRLCWCIGPNPPSPPPSMKRLQKVDFAD